MPNVTVYPMVGVSSSPASCGPPAISSLNVEAAGVRQRRVNLVLDAADAIAFGDGELERCSCPAAGWRRRCTAAARGRRS